MFLATQAPAHFGPHDFYHGRFEPEGREAQFVLSFCDEHSEGAQLIHHVACPQEEGGDGREEPR